MKSPAHQAFKHAETQFAVLKDVEAIIEAREEITAGLDSAFDAIPVHSVVTIEDYSTSPDGETLGLTIKNRYDGDRITRGSREHNLDINGSLKRSGTNTVVIPMYRVSRAEPSTDGGVLLPHYEISVADTDSETGYSPLALVEQSILRGLGDTRVQGSPRVVYDIFNSHKPLRPEDIQELNETGLYVNPHGTAMLDEVKSILSLVCERAANQPVAA